MAMKHLSMMALAAATLAAGPALAATGPFFSLYNTDFVVLLAFLLFVGILLYFKVPSKIGGLLDKRADTIRGELEEARALREEAQTILATYERKQKEVQGQADRIVASAREEAAAAAEQAKADLERSIQRRLAAADEQIASAEAGAVREVRDRAAQIAVEVAAEVVAKQMSSAEQNRLINDAIGVVQEKLH